MSASKSNSIQRLKVHASTQNLAIVRDFVVSTGGQFGLTDRQLYDVQLAVDEAFTNIIKHAYQFDESQTVDIIISQEKNELTVALQDTGNCFDASAYKEPDVKERIKHKKRGGVGVYLIKKLMDKVQYSSKGKVNTIQLTKQL